MQVMTGEINVTVLARVTSRNDIISRPCSEYKETVHVNCQSLMNLSNIHSFNHFVL